MLRRYRRLIVSVLIPVMLSAFGWSVSMGALADECESAQIAASAGGPAAADPTSLPGSEHLGKSCNHGCHATGHLLGQITDTGRLPVPTSPAGEHPAVSFILPIGSPDTPYRPPSIPSRA